jgi:GntR family carbon starvation induced transcriptional regulator
VFLKAESARQLDRGLHPSIRAAIAEILRDDIMSGRLPAGAKIPIKDIGLAFGVATSVVREALLHLVADGLTIAEEQRGFRVASMSDDELRDICRVRIELECFLISDSIEHGDAEWESRLVGSLHHLTTIAKRSATDARIINPEYAEQHRVFHESLTSASGSQWMLRFYRTILRHTERYRQLIVSSHNHREIDNEHHKLVEAVVERDAARARALITVHVNESMERLLKAREGPA